MIPAIPNTISGRVFEIRGFSGWDHLLEFLPRSWRLRILAKRLLKMKAIAVGECFMSPGDGCYRIATKRGDVKWHSIG